MTPESTHRHVPAALHDDLSKVTGTIRFVTLWGAVINLLLSILKAGIGIMSGSQALVADAVHSLSDLATDIAVLFGAPYWSAPADADHPYGHGRIETAVTVFIGAALGAVGIGLGFKAIMTLAQQHGNAPGWAAFGTALVSIVVKEALYQWTIRVGKQVRSSAVVANAWHHRSDSLSSVPVAIAVLGTKLYPQLSFLDHLATLVVGVFILQAAWMILWPAMNQLVDRGATEEEQRQLRELVVKIPGVHDLHALRTRHIGPGLQVDLHVLVDPDLSVREGHNISGRVKQGLVDGNPDVVDVLIHIEPYEEAHEPAKDSL
jgi:cation diffusion facilitator family transporter